MCTTAITSITDTEVSEVRLLDSRHRFKVLRRWRPNFFPQSSLQSLNKRKIWLHSDNFIMLKWYQGESSVLDNLAQHFLLSVQTLDCKSDVYYVTFSWILLNRSGKTDDHILSEQVLSLGCYILDNNLRLKPVTQTRNRSQTWRPAQDGEYIPWF